MKARWTVSGLKAAGAVATGLCALFFVIVFVIVFVFGREVDRQALAPAPAPSTSTPAPISPVPAAPPSFLGPGARTDRETVPPMPGADLDLEVCRSLRATCPRASFPPDRCHKSGSSWTSRLSTEHVHCIIAARGLLDRRSRAAWIRWCEPTLNCP